MMKTSWTVPRGILLLCVATVTVLATALRVPLAPAAEAVKVVSIADFEKDTDDFSRPLQRDAAVGSAGPGLRQERSDVQL